MIGIIDYSVGNIRSVENAVKYNHPDLKVKLLRQPDELKECDKIILPGVGAFAPAIEKIREMGFAPAIFEEVKKGKLLLGICLGMQLLANKSYEFGEHQGLGLIEGEVIGFREAVQNIQVPHIGWNNVSMKENKIFTGIENNADFYFVHSYFFKCSNPSHSIGETDYHITFTSVVNNDNVYGAQFHPEKSQANGLKFIDNFIKL